ncbi:hypothetical protein V6N13_027775 [Hibiscus sabdariffa]
MEPDRDEINRRCWLSILRIPIHAWSQGTFENVTFAWGSFIQINDLTNELTSFEEARLLIATTWLELTDDTIELVINGGKRQCIERTLVSRNVARKNMCKLSGHEHVQVEEHDNQVMVWRHNDLWKESNEDYKGMSTQEIRRGCVLPDEDVNVVI